MPSVIDTSVTVQQPSSLKNGKLNGAANGKHLPTPPTPSAKPLLAKFLNAYLELQSYKNGKEVVLDGHHLTIPAIAAVARFNSKAVLTTKEEVKAHLGYSRDAIDAVNRSGTSIYGVSTGFGGSADTRTDNGEALGLALIQHQHIGVLPNSLEKPLSALPLLDPLTSSSMPESWVRGAILIRMNSLLRGHSGVRWEVVKTMGALLENNITPMVPMRGSISASGDLSPLSYVAGSISANPYLRVYSGPAAFGARKTTFAPAALKEYGITPVSLQSKEHLGIMNGTAFSASVAALALSDAVHLALLAQVCTAMGTEALLGARGSFDPFLHNTCRPHPGQIEVAANIFDLLERSKLAEIEHEDVNIEEDKYTLRQDRYSLRTAAQFLGPQVEDLLKALDAITIECNSTTDNPLVDWSTGKIHHGGNFQAMHVTNAMESTRVALHHIGKLLFSQSTELLNPTTNRGLPPSLAATEPSLDYHSKGVDIATAAYVSELGWLANPVSTHIQSAEMHNQSVNSLALISGRATIQSLDVLTNLIASYLYLLAQALDLRAMQADFLKSFKAIVKEELDAAFGEALTVQALSAMSGRVYGVMLHELDQTTTMDSADRFEKVAASSTTILVDFLSGPENAYHRHANVPFVAIPTFRSNVVLRSVELQKTLREEYLTGKRSASPFLNHTRPVYEYIRKTLGVRMYGYENFTVFANGLGGDDPSIGQNISTIQESIRDGNLQTIVASLFVQQ